MVGVLTLNSRDKAVFSSIREGGLGFGIGKLSEASVGLPWRFNAVAVISDTVTMVLTLDMTFPFA